MCVIIIKVNKTGRSITKKVNSKFKAKTLFSCGLVLPSLFIVFDGSDAYASKKGRELKQVGVYQHSPENLKKLDRIGKAHVDSQAPKVPPATQEKLAELNAARAERQEKAADDKRKKEEQDRRAASAASAANKTSNAASGGQSSSKKPLRSSTEDTGAGPGAGLM